MKLTFETKQKAINAEKQIWINYLDSKFVENKELVGTQLIEYESLDSLANNEKVNLKIYGDKSGMICKDCGLTQNYATIMKVYELEKWYFEKPVESLMTNVTDYSEEEFNKAWEPPTEF